MTTRRIIADLDIAKQMTEVKAGDFFEHKKTKYEIRENREILGKELDYELVIERSHRLYKAQYSYVTLENGADISFTQVFTNDKGEQFVEFSEVEAETKVSTEYKSHKDIDDIFPVENVRDIAKKIVSGQSFVKLNDVYHLVNLVINRKSKEKFEVRVVKDDGSNIETKDIVMIEAFIKVLEKVRMLDYTIIFDVKEKKPSLSFKATIGFEKFDDDQKSLFDKDQDPKAAKDIIEEIKITNIEEEKITDTDEVEEIEETIEETN